MFVEIPPKYSVSQIVGYLKGKSSPMIFDKFANLKYRYGNRCFWCRGYYVDSVEKNEKKIAEYIRTQLQDATDKGPYKGQNKPPADPVVMIMKCSEYGIIRLSRNKFDKFRLT